MVKTRWPARFSYAVLLLGALACEDDKVIEIRGCNAKYPKAPPGAKQILHVAKCASDKADGSAQAPYATIAQGLGALIPGGTLLIGPGVYEESVAVDRPASLYGTTEEDEPGSSVAIQPPASIGVTSQPGEGGSVVLSGLRVQGAQLIGIDARDGQLTLSKVSVIDTRKGEFKDETGQTKGEVGFGVIVRDATLDADGLTVENSPDTGLLFQGGSGAVRRSKFARNGLGGVRTDKLASELTVADCEFEENTQLGIGVFAGPVVLTKNKILNTKFHPPSGVGDGILVTLLQGSTASVPATLDGNTVSGSARVGMLFGQGSLGSATGNEVSGSAQGVGFGAGIWLQTSAGGDAGITLASNKISKNRFLGIAVTSSSRATLSDNTIEDTSEAGTTLDDGGSGTIGDGVGLFDESTVKMSNNSIARNQRVGLITDNVSAAAITIQGNTFSENTLEGVVIQNTAGATPIDASNNTYQNNPTQGPRILTDAKDYLGVRKKDFKAN
jgi:parallel beta-helix repeat protein